MKQPAFTVPRVGGVVETCINITHVDRAREFYQSLFGFEAMAGDDRFCAFRVEKDVLLLFKENASETSVKLPGGVIPPHATQGAGALRACDRG